jgi:Dyp-type peroxidase family
LLTLKYFQLIENAQAETRREGADLAEPFDLSALGADTWLSRWEHKTFDFALKAGFFGLRKLWPVAKIGRLVIVSRAADVRKVLKDREHFAVPFALEMTELAGGETFVLGLEDQAHDWQRAIISGVMSRNDIGGMRTKAREVTEALIANSRGRIDVVKDLFARVSTEVCLSYFGLATADPDAFSDWLFSISALLFADPFGSANTRALALKGSAGVRGVIDRALALAPAEPDPTTLLGRLKLKQRTELDLTDAKIKAIFVGLATGLVPTTTLAAGKLFVELLGRPEELRKAIALATAGDMDGLQGLLFEAARLNSALSPGLWRYCRKATTLGKVSVPEGTVVLVGTASALVDETENPQPYEFKLGRPSSSFDLAFGMDWHECMGKWVAMALITEIAAIVLKLPGFQPAPGRDGRMGWVGAFPRRLDVVFDSAVSPAGFAMVTVAAPLAPGVDSAKIKAALEALGNPAPDPVKTAIEQAGTIHFVSASVLEFGDDEKPRPTLVIEINADGNEDQAIAATARALGPTLGPIVNTATQVASLENALHRYKIDLKTRPFGAIGLNYPGLGEFSVRDIDRQSRLADFAKEAVAFYQQTHLGRGGTALDALEFVRGLIRPTAATAAAIAADKTGRLADLARRGPAFANDLLLPSRRRLALMDWNAPSVGAVIGAILRDPTDLTFSKCLVALLFAVSTYWGLYRLPWPHAKLFEFNGLSWLLVAAGALAIGALVTIIVIALVALLAVGWLRRLETSDQPDNREPSLAKIRAAAAVEDAPGYAQNHFTSVSDLKPGFFRKMTLAAALWGIKELVTRLYRPGFVLDLGTINFARWFRPPGAEKLVFFSNFDGSWHSYLEDFITKAHAGQSAAWSNGVGFPKTRFLLLDGAKDGDSFKRWVRRQQVVTQFWRPRFPELPADIKRANALIHFGLARATDETEARDWLSQFGSMARPEGVVETDEAQSLVFRSFGHLPEGEFVALRFPEDKSRLRKWLAALSGEAESSGLGLSFGDYPGDPADPQRTAAILSLSPSGLIKAGFPLGEDGGPSTEFPSAFNLGMASRGKVLGDLAESRPENWRWSDSADAMLIVFGKTREATERCVGRHLAALGPGAALHRVPTTPTDKGIGYEPFGFRDGISQPVIKGTRRHAKGAPDRDLLEAGEFLLGYRNSGGYYAPSPAMPAQYDPFNRLPTKQTEARTEVPKLDASTALRDFGRNGSFMAVRQILQDVEGFDAQAKRVVAEMERKAEVERAIGEPIDEHWAKAKMMGRRQEGEPLVDRNAPLPEGAHPDNDFDFASDDPEGLRCPIGAHVRRANPRASLGDDDADSQTIVNRHRILRRGRPYRYTAPSGQEEQGLMFVAVCADIERQFEFVQQSWLNAPNFGDLRGEPDPIVGSTEGVSPARGYSVPTAFGPICFSGLRSFVEIKGGGYFFLPSRSALRYLAG